MGKKSFKNVEESKSVSRVKVAKQQDPVKNVPLESLVPESFSVTQANKAIDALLAYIKSNSSELFMDDTNRFLLDVTAFKIPKGNKHMYHVVLPHAPVPIDDRNEILLIVGDTKNVDPDYIVQEVKNELSNSSEKISVKHIMTLCQCRDEHSTFFKKRNLSKTVDAVIAEQKFFPLLPKILGREFYKKKKIPISIPGRKFKKKDLGEQISYALRKTTFNISLKGMTSTLMFGHDGMSSTQLKENVCKVINWINQNFPGGWKNVARMAIHNGSQKFPPLVVHFSEGSKDDIPNQPICSGGKLPKPVEDELSTMLTGRVVVHPTGNITVKRSSRNLDAEDKEILRKINGKLPRKLRKRVKSEIKKDVDNEEFKEDKETTS